MALQLNTGKTTQPTAKTPGLVPPGAAAVRLTPGITAAPVDAEKPEIKPAHKRFAPKKPGKPHPDVQDDSSAAEDGKALNDSQSSDSAQATSDEGMARASLTDKLLSSDNSNPADLALSEGSLATSSLSASVLDSLDNSLDAAATHPTAVLLAQASDTGNTTAPEYGNTPNTPAAAPEPTSPSPGPLGVGWGIWAGAGAAAVGGLALAGGGGGNSATPAASSPPTPPTPSTSLGPAVTIQNIGLGPLITTDPGKPIKLTASVYAADGKTLMGTGTVNAQGQASFTLDYAYNNYSGAAIVKITGTASYLDEATNLPKNFDSATSGPMLAALVLSGGQAVTVNVNPLTTFAAIEAGVQPDGSVDTGKAPFNAETVKAASTQVARLVGLTGDNAGDKLTQITPVFAVGKSVVDGTDLSSSSDAAKVGTFLALVSGLEKSQSTDAKPVTTKDVIQQLNDSFDSTQTDDGKAIAPLLLQGAGQVSALGSSVNSYVYDKFQVITVGITSDKLQLKGGDTANITFTFSVDPGNTFDAADIVPSGGTLGTLSGSGTTRTATFTPTPNVDKGTASISVKADSYTGAGGSVNKGQAGSSPMLTVDTKAPLAPTSVALAADTGSSDSDGITTNRNVNVTLAEAGGSWEYSTDSGGSWSAGSGTSFTLAANQTYAANTIQVRQTDAAGNVGAIGSITTGGITTAVTVDNTAPVFSSAAAAPDFAENTAAVTVAYNATASDTGTVSYSLKAGGDAADFNISNSGAVTFKTSPNFEAKSGYSFTVIATDAAGNTSERAVTLAVTNVDEVAPTFSSGATATAIAENSGAGQVIYTAAAADTDFVSPANASSISYSLKANTGDEADFSINSGTGAVTLTASPNFEAKPGYSFTVIATDAAGNTREREVTLAVTNVDEVAPTFSSGATATAIAENSGAGQVIYTAAAADTDFPGATGSVTYSLKANTGDVADFSINSGTGAVTLTASPNFESKPGYSFTVIATDAAGNTSEQAVTLAVTNVDDTAPTFSSGATATAIAENSGAGQVVYTAAATDTDFVSPANASSISYSLKANTGDVADFSINSGTGAVTLTASPNFEAKPGYSFTVIATDAAGNTREQEVTLAVTNVNEAPTVKATAPDSVVFVVGTNAVSLGLTDVFTDEDVGDTLSYSLTVGTLPSGLAFANGVISGTPTGSDSSASFTFTADDGHGLSVSKTILIDVATKPKVSRISVFDSGTGAMAEAGRQGETVSLLVTLSETVTVGGTLDASNLSATFTAGGTALSSVSYVSQATEGGKTVLRFTGTLPSGNASSVVLTSLTLSNGLNLTGNISQQAMDTSQTGLTVSDSYALDNTAPAAPTSVALAADTGSSDSDGITTNRNVNVTLAEAGGSWEYSTDSGGSWSAGSGTSFTLAANQTYAANTIQVRQTDAAGNVGAIGSITTGGITTAVTVDNTAPVFSSAPAAPDFAENTAAATVAYNATASDTGTVSYSLKAGGDAADFNISNSGAVTFKTSPNFEAKSGYSFTVIATDAAGNTSERAVTLAVTNVDEVAPTFSSGATATAIAENSGAGQVVYTAAAADTDFVSPANASSVTYSLKANTGDVADFSINSNTGAVTLTASPNFEAKSGYSFTVIATDAAGNTSERAVTLAVTNVDEVAPTFSSGATATAIAENSGAGQVIYTAAAADTDFVSPANASSISYSLKANTGDVADFSINSGTGAVTLTASPNFEAKPSYSFTVIATDAAGNTSERAVTLAVTNVDEVAPTFSSGATATAIAENSGAGQVVYTAAAADTDFVSPANASSVTYSLKANTGDVADFSINSGTGAVTLTASPNFEAKHGYSFTVIATDAAGNTSERAVTLAVTNVDDTAPTFSSGATATAIAENSGPGQVIYTAAAADTDFPGATGSVTYSLKANTGDVADFSINSNTGAVTLTASPNFEAKPGYSFTVIATDAAGNAREQEVTLAVTNVNEAPVNTVPASALTAITATALTISSISVSDVDAGSNGVASVQLRVLNGTVSVSSTASGGLVAGNAISGSGTATLTLTGSQSAINATLATLSYTSNAGHTGADTLTVLTTDGGASAMTDSDTVSIDNTITVDTAPPVIAASPSLALKTSAGTAATGDIGAGGQAVLTIDLGEAAANLTGLPTLDNSTIIKVNGTGKSATWTTSGNNLVLTYTAGNSDNGAITVDAAALKTALAGITDIARNAAMIGGSTWDAGSFTAPTTSRVVDSAKPVLDLNGAADGVNNVLASNIGNSATAINLTGGANNSTTAPYIDLPDVLLGGDLTLEAWVNFSAMRDGQRVFDIGNGNNNNNLILLVNANGTTISSIRVDGTAVDVSSPAGNPALTLVAGQWYHLALVVTSSTQKVFVNGVEWSSGGLPPGFSTNAALTRTNTWIGRSNFGEAFSNMQVKDVRVFDDARNQAELTADAVDGSSVNPSDTDLRLAYKFDGNLQSSLPNGLAATAMNFLTADSPQFLAPNATLSETGNVQSVQVTVSGVRDSASEKLSAGGSSIAADGSVTSGTVTVAANGAIPASTWTWAYVAGAGAGTGTFTFTATAAGGVSSSAAQNLLRSLAYSDTATTPTAGSRGFSITATDVAGNTSTAVIATLNRAPTSQIDLDNTSNGNDFSNPALNVSVVNTAQGSPIAPNAALLTSDSSVSRIQVRLGGDGLDLVNDKLVLNGTAAGGNPVTVALNVASSTPSLNDISIGGIGGLRYSYNSTSKLLIITATSGSIAAADVDDIVKALVFRNSLVSPRTGVRTFQVSVVNMAGEGTSSTSTLTLVDNLVPVAPTLTLGSGVANGATLAEATAATGVVLVNAESGSTVRVTFTDSLSPVNSFVKTVTGTGAALAITLDATELGTGVGKLYDGTISVTAVATDVNGNASAAGQTSLNLDTQAPAQPALATKSGQDNTITSNEASIDIEVNYTGMVAGDVIALFNGASAMGSAYTVTAADVAAGKATINVLNSLLGGNGSKNITARVTDAAGNPPSSVSTALELTVSNTAPGIVIKAGQDAYVNASETSIDLEVRSSQLAVGDTIQLKLDGSALGTLYTVVQEDVTAGKATITVLKSALTGGDGSKSITADYIHAGGAAAVTSPTLTLTLDTAAPSSLVLAVKAGEDATINASETGVNLELTGTHIAAGDLVTLKNGNTILVNAYLVTAADVTAGKVALTVPATALGADGVKSLTAEVRDAAGNSGTSGTLSVTLDTVAPLLALQPGSGADAFINSAEAAAAAGVSVSVTGVSVGDVITIKEGATVLSGPTTLTAAMITAGTYSTTFARSQMSLGDGVKTLSVVATDAAGNTGRANQLDLLVDSTAPAALTVTTPQTLTENTVHVGSALTLPTGASAWQIGGTDAAFFAMDGNQLRFVTPPDFERPRNAASSGSNTNAYSITLTAVDAAGNTAGGVAAQTLTITVANVPSEGTTPVLTLQPGRSSGVSHAEASSGLGVLSVVGAASATVTVVFSRSGGGTVTKTIAQNANGAASNVLLTAADLATLGEGSISVSSSSAAGAGNNLTFTLDTTAPTGVSLAASPASGSVFNTATHTLTLTANFTGLADGDTLTLLENGVPLKQTFTVSNAASGTQTLTLPRYLISSGDGTKTLTLVATDAAGNSTASTALTLTVDTTPPTLRSNALIGGVDSSVNHLQLAVDDAVGNDSSTSNGISTSPYIHITGLDAGSSWQYSLDSGSTWTLVAAHNARATDATLALPASSTAYASGTVQVRQVDASGLTSPVTSNSMAFTITPTMTVSGALDDANTSATLQAVPARYLRITTNTANQSLNWSDLRVWVLQNGIETELTRSGWVFSGSPGIAGVNASNLTDASTSTAYNAAAVGNGTWLQADLGGYYSVSRVQLINTNANASNQTVSLSTNDMGASGIGVGHLLGDATVQNFNTGTLGNNSTLTLTPSLATDDSTPTLQGKLASSAALASGTEYAVYITNLDNAVPAPSKLAGTVTVPSGSSDWSFTPTTALSDGRYAFTLVRQAMGNSSFSHPTVVPSASSLVLNIDNNGTAANPVLDLNGSAVSGNNTSVDSFIGSRSPITLAGGPDSPTAPYVDLPDVSLGQDLTLEAWVNFSTLEGSRVFDIGNGQSSHNLILGVGATGTVISSIRVGETPVDVLSTIDNTHPALVTGRWYHMALVVSGSTQKVFVNGDEWLSGTLPGTFASNAPITRTQTWIGRSGWPGPFTAMQVRDVRVYDDARTAEELSSDMNGTPVDVTDPNLRLAYKLQGNGKSSIPGQADAELVNISSASNNVFRLASNAVLSDASLIASITVAVNSVPDGAAEKLFVDGNELAANGAVTSGTLTACNAQWNWTYAAATGFTFTAVGNANGGGGVPATLAQAFVQSLAYQNTALPATIGTRSFSISTTDVFGHLSSVAIANLQDATLPGISNLPITGLLLLPNQDTDLADLVFNKGGDPDNPGTLNLTVQATNASISGLTDSDGNLANGIQLQGTAAQLSSTFASARIRPAAGGLPGLTLTLSEGANRSVTNTYLLIGDDTFSPVLDLNGAANGNTTAPNNFLGSLNPINLSGGAAGSAAPFVDLPDVALGGDFTLEAQVNFSSLFNWERVFDIGNGQDSSNLLLGVQANGQVSLALRNGSTVLVDTSSPLDGTHPPLLAGQWYHLALVVSGTTAKAYVNGVEWVSGTLSATVSNTTRTNTWIGKSAWADNAFSNMQVKDVRVYDDARTPTELISDKNGDPVNTADTDLRLAYPLLGDGKSSISGQADATLINLGTVASSRVALTTSTATLIENSLIKKLQVSIAGILDGAAEKLWVGNTPLAANGSVTSGSVTVGTVTWAWTWAAASGFTFTLSNTGATVRQAQGLLQSFGYSVNGASSIGDRVVSITATDMYDRTSSAVTASLLDQTVPDISNLPNMALMVSRTPGMPTPLADLVFNKGGSTTTNATINVTITATNGNVSGLTDADPATAGIQLSGTPATLTSAFAAATFLAEPSGAPGLSLVFRDSAGHTAMLVYPVIADDATAPILDLNGAAAPGNDTAVASIIGSNRPINLTGGLANSASAPYLDLPDVPLGNDLTLQAWVNFSTLDGSRVFDIGNGQNADNLILAVGSNGSVTISLRVGGTPADFANAIDTTHPALVTGQWYHMALVVSGNTQKAYVNGVEWVSGTFLNGFASRSSSTRTNTWIGKSAWAEAFTNMQIRDVRIFDDARTLGEVSADAADITPVDTKDPNLRLAYALNGNVRSSLPSGTPATAVNLNLGYSPQVLAPGATLSEDNTVRSLQITVTGILGGSDEKLIVAGTAIAANGAVASGALLSGSTPWNWTYAAATSTFTFTAPTGGVSSALAQDLLRSLAYNDTSATQQSGNRTVSITVTDIFGHISTAATATVDTALPGINNMPTNPLGVARSSPATATDLANLVFTKGDSISATDVLSVTVLATNATIGGLTDADNNAANGIQLSGTAAALTTQFASATLTPDATGTPTLNLTLRDAVGHTTHYSYPIRVTTASETTPPLLDLNGSLTGNNLVQGSGIGNTQPFNLTGGASTSTTAAYIALPNVPLGGDLTLEARVNFTKLVGGGRVFDIGNGSSSSNLILTVDGDGKVIMSLRNGSTPLFDDQASSQKLVPGTWYHLALVVNGSTAKIFVDGVEWATGNFYPSTSITDMTRANTWIGRSNFGEAFSNMQVKDVRVFDDARTTGAGSELASDVSGTAVDPDPNTDPNLRLAYKLEGSTASSISGGLPAEAVNLLARNTGTPLAPAAVLTDDSPIQSFSVGVSGLSDGADEKLMLGNTSIALNGSVTSGTLPVGADNWSWAYAAATSTFTFTAPTGGVPNYTVQGLLQSLKYTNTDTTPTGGTRVFSITATDIYDNVSAAATSSIDTGSPSITNLPASALPLTRSTAIALADLLFDRGGNTSSADTLTLSIFAVNGTIGGLTDADATADGIQLTGTTAQLETAFTPATFTAAASGTPKLLFNLTDTVGHSVNYQYPLSA